MIWPSETFCYFPDFVVKNFEIMSLFTKWLFLGRSELDVLCHSTGNLDSVFWYVNILFSFFSNMPPQGQNSWVLYETAAAAENKTTVAHSAQKREWQIVWRNIIIVIYVHIAGVYGAFLFFTQAKWATCAFGNYIFVFTLIFNSCTTAWIPQISPRLCSCLS